MPTLDKTVEDELFAALDEEVAAKANSPAKANTGVINEPTPGTFGDINELEELDGLINGTSRVVIAPSAALAALRKLPQGEPVAVGTGPVQPLVSLAEADGLVEQVPAPSAAKLGPELGVKGGAMVTANLAVITPISTPDVVTTPIAVAPQANVAVQYEDHPYANLFPLLGHDNLLELAENIRLNRLQDPIVLFENKILDGRNRYRACNLAGVEPKFIEWQGKGSALDYVVSVNLHRRHLTDQQRAFVAAEDKSRKTQKVGNFSKNAINSQRFELSRICDNSNPGVKEVTKQVAEQFEVSSKAVEQAQVILNKGTPELITAAKANEINMSKAAALAKLSPDEQAAELAAILGTGNDPSSEIETPINQGVGTLPPDGGKVRAETSAEQAPLDNVTKYKAALATIQVVYKAARAKRQEGPLVNKLVKLAASLTKEEP